MKVEEALLLQEDGGAPLLFILTQDCIERERLADVTFSFQLLLSFVTQLKGRGLRNGPFGNCTNISVGSSLKNRNHTPLTEGTWFGIGWRFTPRGRSNLPVRRVSLGSRSNAWIRLSVQMSHVHLPADLIKVGLQRSPAQKLNHL